MKLQIILIAVWSVLDIVYCQFPLQYPAVVQRTTLPNVMRPRNPLVVNRPRWPMATNQLPLMAQRPYKPMFTYAKGFPHAYRGQKITLKHPNAIYPNQYKNTIAYRPTVIKDGYKGSPIPIGPLNGIQHTTLKPITSQKLVATSTPIKTLISNPSPSSILTGSLTKNYLANSIPASNVVKGPQTSRPLTVTSTSIPSAIYPIRVDGEGGPIHTIPAPNLSLADKPIVVPDYQNYLVDRENKVRSGHTYEVREENGDNSNAFSSTNEHLTPSKLSDQFFSLFSQQSTLPQPMALKTQPIAPSLTSEELFAILNGGTSQQQLSDTYAFPLIQQPQLQQYFAHQTYDQMKPLQPFNAVIQPVGGSANIQNVLFKPEPNYVENVQKQLLKHTISQPVFESFNYQEPSLAEKLKTNSGKVLQDSDHSPSHFNLIRSTQESVIQDANNNLNKTNSAQDLFNIETKNNFHITNLTENIASGSSNIESAYLAEIENLASSSLFPSYYNALTGNQESMIAMPNMNTDQDNFKPNSEDFFMNISQHYSLDNANYDNYGNDFLPANPLKYKNEDQQNDQASIRVFMPENYNDNLQQTENIKVSASMNTDEAPKNDMMIIFENDGDNSKIEQYDDSPNDSESEENDSFSNLEEILKDVTTPSNKRKTGDVEVTVPQNATNPTLDIRTKDWKTSIIIKPKSTSKLSTNTELNQVTEFGSRLRPKRE